MESATGIVILRSSYITTQKGEGKRQTPWVHQQHRPGMGGNKKAKKVVGKGCNFLKEDSPRANILTNPIFFTLTKTSESISL